MGARRMVRRAATAALAFTAALAVGVAPASATLSDVGPADADTGLPTYYQDVTGLRLQPCLVDVVNCVPGSTVPNPDAPPSVYTGNLAPEEFYYEADARIAMPGGGQALLVVGLQNGWTSMTSCGKSPCPEPGKQAIFGRVRFRIDGLTPGLQYTVRYPWGTQVVTPVATTNGVRSVNVTIDTGCAATAGAVPCDPRLALGAIVGPFLGWDPAVAPAAPDGFLGSYAVPHAITGSRVLGPDGRPQNYFSIEGPDLPPVRTDLFQVAGQLATPAPADTAAPSAPTGLAATAAADGSVQLSWNPATDDRAVTAYEVRRDGVALPPVTGTTATDTGLASGSTHAYTVSAIDAAHNVSAASDAVTVTVPVAPPVDPSTVPPTAPGPVAATLPDTTPPTTLGTASVPVGLGWAPATAPAGVTAYDVSVTSADGGSATTARAPGTALTAALAPGHRYDAAVRARTAAGLVGDWRHTSFALALSQENDAAVTYSKGWARKKLTGAYGGSVMQTSTARATATFRFTGTAVAWAATTAPGAGQATVSLDGTALPSPVDLRAATTTPRRLVLVRSGLPAGAHTLTVTAPATTGKGKAATTVDVDAFAVLAP